MNSILISDTYLLLFFVNIFRSVLSNKVWLMIWMIWNDWISSRLISWIEISLWREGFVVFFFSFSRSSFETVQGRLWRAVNCNKDDHCQTRLDHNKTKARERERERKGRCRCFSLSLAFLHSLVQATSRRRDTRGIRLLCL